MARTPDSDSTRDSYSLVAGKSRDHVDDRVGAVSGDSAPHGASRGDGDSDQGVSSGKGALPKPKRQSRRRQAQRRLQELRIGRGRKQWVLTVPSQQSAVRLTILAVLVVAMTMTVASPLKSYFQQRSELQQLHIDIVHQEKEKAELQKQLALYNDDDFVKEQARLRLGMVERGETAWRIIDPSIKSSTPEESLRQKDKQQDPWYTQLWSSVRTKPADKHMQDEDAPALGVPTVKDPDPNHGE